MANIYLHPLDELVTGAEVKMVRYADDFVILCKGESQAQKALQPVREWTEVNGLTLHPDKNPFGRL
uniref:Reverse transcriptase (RNA-dependent DNA polymerase) n=1 Tax=Candidatus Kentrum sp. TC TaxID=2126339 RepID=A0A451A6H3_9GAMM|nr:MAG: Reverse transcriptase (RNA-dependent DNA polymerase) [Candidatus Kentron sp. TC]